MLGKCLKYDLKYVYKVLIIFYLIDIGFAIITRILFAFDNSFMFHILALIASGTTISFMFSIIINNLMRVWARFVKNIYGDESYLTHTLPISKSTIYTSKFLASIITMFTSILVILLCVFIAYYSQTNLEVLKNTLQFLATSMNSTTIKVVLVAFLCLFLEFTMFLQAGFTGILLGHRSNNSKMAKSVLYGFLNYLFVVALSVLIIYIIGLFNPNIMALFNSNASKALTIDIVKTALTLGICLYITLIAIYYYIDIKIFQKGVNVD